MIELEIAKDYEENSKHYDEFYKQIAKGSGINLNEFKCQKMARYAIVALKYISDFNATDFKNITLDEYMDFIKFIDENIRNIYLQPDFSYNVDKRQYSNGQIYNIEGPLHSSFRRLLETSEMTVENIEKWKNIYSEKHSVEIVKKINTFKTIKESNIKLF